MTWLAEGLISVYMIYEGEVRSPGKWNSTWQLVDGIPLQKSVEQGLISIQDVD